MTDMSVRRICVLLVPDMAWPPGSRKMTRKVAEITGRRAKMRHRRVLLLLCTLVLAGCASATSSAPPGTAEDDSPLGQVTSCLRQQGGQQTETAAIAALKCSSPGLLTAAQ